MCGFPVGGGVSGGCTGGDQECHRGLVVTVGSAVVAPSPHRAVERRRALVVEGAVAQVGATLDEQPHSLDSSISTSVRITERGV